MFRQHFLALSLVAFAFLACNDEEDKSPPTNGVNDVSKACAIRARWTRGTVQECSNCLGISVVPFCDCSTEPYAGKCSEQKTAKIAEPACGGVGECVFGCAASDCACVDACYANKEACRVRASALDGCLAEVCDSYCR